MKGQLVTGALFAFGGQVVNTVASLAGTALLARILSPQDVGLYFILFSVVSIASVICQFGLGRTVVRMVAESSGGPDPGRARATISKALLVVAVSGGLLSALMYSTGTDFLAHVVFHIPAMDALGGVLVLWFSILAFRSIVCEAFRGLHDLRGAVVFGDMTSRCLFLALMAALFVCCKHATLQTVIALHVASLAVTAAAGLIALHRKVLPRRAARPVSVAALAAASWPVLLTDVTTAAYTQIDIWLLGAFADPQSVALYGAAARLALLVPMPLIVVSTVTAPYIASLHSTGRQRELQLLLTRTTSYAAVAAAGAVLLYLIAGELLLRLIYGEPYARAYPVLVVLALGQLAVVALGPAGLTLTMTGRQKILLTVTLASTAVLVLGGVVLIPAIGPIGMAVTSAVVTTGASALAAVMAARSAGVRTHASTDALTPAAAVAGGRELLRLIRAKIRSSDE